MLGLHYLDVSQKKTKIMKETFYFVQQKWLCINYILFYSIFKCKEAMPQTKKLATYFLCQLTSLEALGPWLRMLKRLCHDGHGWEHSQEASWSSAVTLAHSQYIAGKGTETLISLSSWRVAITFSSLHYFFTFTLWLVTAALEQYWKRSWINNLNKIHLMGVLTLLHPPWTRRMCCSYPQCGKRAHLHCF